MAITNILPGVLWANSGGQLDTSVTIVRPGGPGWAFAEAELA